jgi:hypothetical protein
MQALELFTKIIKTDTVIKMLSWSAWLVRPSGLIKRGWKRNGFEERDFD